MQNFENKLISTEKSLNNIRGIFDKNRIRSKLKQIEEIVNKEDFWQNQKLAKKQLSKKIIMRKFSNLLITL